MELDRYKWVSQLEPIINKHNNTKHSTIKMSPNDAKNGNNHLTVSYNIWDGVKRNRKFHAGLLNWAPRRSKFVFEAY
jgi:hypothetical protein